MSEIAENILNTDNNFNLHNRISPVWFSSSLCGNLTVWQTLLITPTVKGTSYVCNVSLQQKNPLCLIVNLPHFTPACEAMAASVCSEETFRPGLRRPGFKSPLARRTHWEVAMAN